MVLLTKGQQQNEANIYEHKIASNNGESDYTHCLKYYSVLFKYFFYRGLRYAFGHSVLSEKICLTFNYIGRVFIYAGIYVGRVPKSGVSKHFRCLKEVRLFPKI